jgi:hypothetical protein
MELPVLVRPGRTGVRVEEGEGLSRMSVFSATYSISNMQAAAGIRGLAWLAR